MPGVAVPQEETFPRKVAASAGKYARTRLYRLTHVILNCFPSGRIPQFCKEKWLFTTDTPRGDMLRLSDLQRIFSARTTLMRKRSGALRCGLQADPQSAALLTSAASSAAMRASKAVWLSARSTSAAALKSALLSGMKKGPEGPCSCYSIKKSPPHEGPYALCLFRFAAHLNHSFLRPLRQPATDHVLATEYQPSFPGIALCKLLYCPWYTFQVYGHQGMPLCTLL